MDLSTFQLVDAINDMDMLRNLSNQQQQQQQQQQQGGQQYSHHQHQQAHSSNAYNQLQGDIDLLFQSNHTNASPHMNAYLPPSSSYKTNSATTTTSVSGNSQSNQIMSSPHYRYTSQQHHHHRTDCFDQEDILTPLISPAMTPSFSYQVQQQKHHQTMNFSNGNNEMDFSPLSSPAILPQMDRHNKNQPTRTSYQDQLASASVSSDSNSNKPNGDCYENMSANQICEQYEQLEHAKLLITQKLSELQKSQRHQNQYDDHGYQRSLLSSESNSSKDSNSPLSKTNGTSMLQMNSDHMSIHHHHVLSKPNSPNQSPHMEPATPASLMNMKVNSSNSSKLQFSSSGRTQQQYYNNKSTHSSASSTFNSPATTVPATTNSTHVFQSPIMNTNPMQDNNNMMISPMMTPTTTTNHNPAPLSPLALHPRGSKTRSSSTLKEKPTTSSSRLSKKQRRESSDTKTSTNVHASPRALKPLLISPTLNPGIKPPPSSIVPARTVHSVEDAERILATRSNYQNLMEGKGAALGIAFSTQIKSGLEVRRTAHKAAEQKRRDSLKEWFDRLRREVEDGYVKRQKTLMSQVIKAQELEKNNNNKQKGSATDEEMEDATAAAANIDASAMKPLSKVLLLQYAYEYISSLKDTLQERDETIEKLLAGEGSSSNSNQLKRKKGDEEKNSRDDNGECAVKGSDVEESANSDL